MTAFRYLLMVSSVRDLTEVHCSKSVTSQGLAPVSVGPRLALFANQPLLCALLGDGGMIVGHAFHDGDGSGRTICDTLASAAAVPRRIFDLVWGGYLAITFGDRVVQVMRDPSGLLPCYYFEANDVFYFASDVSLFVEQGVLRPRIDFRRVARALYANDLPEAQTALESVRQLLPGMTIDIKGGTSVSRLIWTPWHHVDGRAVEPEELREIVQTCVTRWQAAYASVMVGVSGGLDSSIVTACLRDRLSCRALTISADDAQGDESVFARMLCDDLGIPLSESQYKLGRVDIDRSSFAHLPRPGGRAQLQASNAAVMSATNQYGINAFFTGVGGDNVFHFTTSARPLVDRYRIEGLRPALVETTMDISKLAGVSVWTTLCAAFRLPRAGSRQYRWRPNPRFLTPVIAEQCVLEPLYHPWLEEPVGALPGKAAHVAQLVRAQSYVDAHDRLLPYAMVHPLLSQPIIEAALAIPSWQACQGGVDRSQARLAFRDDLPRSILARRHKGGPDGFAFQILRANLDGVRERLMDGVLASQQIIDRDAICDGLREANLARGEDYVRILLLLDTEAWVRGWLSYGTACVAA